MKLGYNTNGFAYHRLDDAIAILADLGYDAIAITLDVHHLDPYNTTRTEVAKVSSLLGSKGLSVTVESGARFVIDPHRKHWPTLVGSTHEERERREDFLKRCMEMAVELGAREVSFWSGASEEVLSAEETLERMSPHLERLLERGRSLGVRLGLEPEPGMNVESLSDAEPFLDRFSDLGLTLDLGHLNVTETPPYEEAIEGVLSRVVSVHVDDARGGLHEHLMPGEGVMPLESLLEVLAGSGFPGIAAVELARDAHDAVRTARRAYEVLTSYWPSVRGV